MRLAKKIAAIVLAAAMSVSMLTACGGGGSSTGGSNSNSSSSGSKPSSSSSSASSSASSGSSSSSASSSSSSTASSDSNSGNTSGGETVDYAKSRTVKFFQKLGTNYTIDMKRTVTGIISTGESESSRWLVSTNGNRTYCKATDERYINQTEITLIDGTQNKLWKISPVEREVEPGKYGYYIESDGNFGTGDSTDIWTHGIEPITGMKFTKETRGAYYIETQTLELGNKKMIWSYWYEGNNSKPKYIDQYGTDGQTEESDVYTEIVSVDYKANSNYMDFEKILENYIDVTDRMPSNETQS